MATRQKHDSEEERMARMMDDVAEFEEFRQSLLPKLRRAVLEGWSADKIRREVGPHVAARVASMALLGPARSGITMKAAQDTLDRLEGKPIQRQETLHHHTQMTKKELAALVLQKLKDAGIISPDGRMVRSIGSIRLPSADSDGEG